jgi:hypothetical protein
LELLDTKMSRMDNKMSHIDTKVERIKSEVQTAMDERLHERIRLELSALNGDGGSRGGSIAHSTGIKPTMVNTEFATPLTPPTFRSRKGVTTLAGVKSLTSVVKSLNQWKLLSRNQVLQTPKRDG